MNATNRLALGPVGQCKWPACECYAPNGPKACVKAKPLSPRAPISRAYD